MEYLDNLTAKELQQRVSSLPNDSLISNNSYGTDGVYPNDAQKLVEDAVDLAASQVNFANYDNDNDGIVDALFVNDRQRIASHSNNRIRDRTGAACS